MNLGELAPALKKLVAADFAEVEARVLIYSEDIPAAYVRFLCGLPDDAPVASRVDQLWERNRPSGLGPQPSAA